MIGVVTGSLLLASCSQQSALDLAKKACSDVHQSIDAYEQGVRTTSSSARAHDLQFATIELQKAEPLAASATSSDGQWNALMTTLSELGQVDEGHLIPALQAQCSVAERNSNYQPSIQGLGIDRNTSTA